MTQNPASESLSHDTKSALLDAAERLFARIGIAESSTRAITSEAGANLASINYHFGSKEGLVQAVFSRRLQPLNQDRLDLLEECLQEGRGVADLRCLLQAFVKPAMTMMTSQDEGDREFVRLMGRTHFEPTSELQATLVEEFRPTMERFTTEMARSLPGVPREEIIWRYHFMIGSLSHTVAARYMISHRLECLNVPDTDDADLATDRLVDFLLSGWQGLATATGASQESAS